MARGAILSNSKAECLNKTNRMATIESEALRQAVESLYTVFGGYPLTTVEGGPCCVREEHKAVLFAKDLRRLTKDDLGRYSGKAMTTWGNANDFKHFLPRIYELTAEFEAPCEEFVVFNKLEYGKWRTWPAVETEALERYLIVLWQVVLAREEGYSSDYLIPLVNIYPRFDELLQLWEEAEGDNAFVLLGEEVYWNSATVFSHKHLDNPIRSKRFHEWLKSSKVRDRLFAAFWNSQDEAVAEKLGVAYDLIANDIKASRLR